MRDGLPGFSRPARSMPARGAGPCGYPPMSGTTSPTSKPSSRNCGLISPMHSAKQQTIRIYQRHLAKASLAAGAAVAITAVAAVSPVDGRPATPLDVVRVTKISDLAVAPDGRAALFTIDALSPGGRTR